jgi:hypothetical protein
MIAENASMHKTQAVRTFQLDHPNVHLRRPTRNGSIRSSRGFRRSSATCSRAASPRPSPSMRPRSVVTFGTTTNRRNRFVGPTSIRYRISSASTSFGPLGLRVMGIRLTAASIASPFHLRRPISGATMCSASRLRQRKGPTRLQANVRTRPKTGQDIAEFPERGPPRRQATLWSKRLTKCAIRRNTVK